MIESFDVLPCGYLSFRDDGIITACNITLGTWLGHSREELAGRNIESIFTLASRIFYNTHFFPLIKLNSKASEIFLSLKDKNGHDIPVLANAERTGEATGFVIHCVFIRVDERKKYEQELIEARRKAEDTLRENKELVDLSRSLEQQALKLDKQIQHEKAMNENLLQFSKIISHDLQEPIRKIQIFSDMISEDPETVLSSRSKTLSSKINHAARRLKALTKSLEEYIAIDNEKIYTNVDLNSILKTAVSRAAKSRQFFDFEILSDKMPVIEGYQKQLELLFFHLADNAIQFRSQERKLTIKVHHITLDENIFRMSQDRYKYMEHLRISFEDNGIGFQEQYRDNVFQLFKKLGNSATSLGIGLPLVKKIVQNHSGDVQVNSQPDKGTRFQIDIPSKVNH